MHSIINDLVEAAFSESKEALIRKFDLQTEKQNQLLFFFKPEVFLNKNKVYTEKILESAINLFEKYSIEISGALVLSGKKLCETQAMDKHYGFINKVSKNASNILSKEEKANIRKVLKVDNSIPMMGGHEFLENNPSFSPQSLDDLWSTKKSIKIRSGLYTQLFEGEKGIFILLNGFHPSQLSHFTGSDRQIALILLNSNAPWSSLRRRMLGDTFPEKALPESFRRILYDNASLYGLNEVGITNNCAHLSAGPFEALYELNNFLSGIPESNFDLNNTRVAITMTNTGLNENHIKKCINNPISAINGDTISLFDATEEMDTYSSVEFYRLFYEDTK